MWNVESVEMVGAEYGLCGDVWGCCRRVVQATPDPDPPARDNNLLLLIGYCFREAVKDNSKGRGGGCLNG